MEQVSDPFVADIQCLFDEWAKGMGANKERLMLACW
jgi:hypothetical protein